MKVLFTGGGSGGHILPNLALIEALRAQHSAPSYQHSAPDAEASKDEDSSVEERKKNHQSSIINHQSSILYVGQKGGMEEELSRARNIPFAPIQAGKLRRYFDWRNVTDIFRLIVGFFQSLRIVKAFDPDVVFAKGGFVSVPVVLAAALLRKPIVTHESDVIPGLANRLIAYFADTVCVTFPKERYGKKEVWTGLPVREAISDQRSRLRFASDGQAAISEKTKIQKVSLRLASGTSESRKPALDLFQDAILSGAKELAPLRLPETNEANRSTVSLENKWTSQGASDKGGRGDLKEEVLNPNVVLGINQGPQTPIPRKTLLVLGGSLGAREINELVWEHLEETLKTWNVIHVTGKQQRISTDQDIQVSSTEKEGGKNKGQEDRGTSLDPPAGGGGWGDSRHATNDQRGIYESYAFVGDEIVELYKRADIVLTRAGATTIMECILMRKPMILMPLGTHASRGEQWANAKWVWEHGEVVDIFPPLPFTTTKSQDRSDEQEDTDNLAKKVWQEKESSQAYFISDADLIDRLAQGTKRVTEEQKAKSDTS